MENRAPANDGCDGGHRWLQDVFRTCALYALACHPDTQRILLTGHSGHDGLGRLADAVT